MIDACRGLGHDEGMIARMMSRIAALEPCFPRAEPGTWPIESVATDKGPRRRGICRRLLGGDARRGRTGRAAPHGPRRISATTRRSRLMCAQIFAPCASTDTRPAQHCSASRTADPAPRPAVDGARAGYGSSRPEGENPVLRQPCGCFVTRTEGRSAAASCCQRPPGH
jgi:hypothetical protein